ncbi:MAG TPA: hypothetical protein VGV07_19190 [Devosia sp.]|jgi:hypothetical protein|uniref:hypothetical protein n=1 Tax=Devosia sp. TaxID=1871048 RepID=UPI002DDCBEC2|nr:hypothetical protein [Devosia sp.]HEV2517386.1 hypothetical protein [Devosia sp.]
MKIRSLLLGSVAAAGLSTGAFAADLGVLTSLDVCDALGLSGLTISSDTNCLQITGEVKYKFTWGDYQDAVLVPTAAGTTPLGLGVVGGHGFVPGDDDRQDWQSRFDAWIKFVATADSDFGPAKAVLKLKQVQNRKVTNELATGGVDYNQDGDYLDIFDANTDDDILGFAEKAGTGIGSSDTGGVILDEAYVSIGDSTVIMAGKKGSIMNKADDEPLTWLDLFNSEKVDRGVSWGPFKTDQGIGDGGHVIQVTSDLGNGFTVSGGVEKLDGINGYAGTAVGVIAYAGEGISAHITGAAGGILDAEVNNWGIHSGFAGTFDNFKVVLAGAYGHSEDFAYDYWNVLASASATFDMFTIAGAVEAVDDGVTGTDFGASASIGVTVAEGVAINVGGRWYHDDASGADSYQVAAGVSAAVTESITITGEVGYIYDDYAKAGSGFVGPTVTVAPVPAVAPKFADDVFYASAKLAWAPGGGYTSSIKGTIGSGSASDDLGYKIETEFKKTFE